MAKNAADLRNITAEMSFNFARRCYFRTSQKRTRNFNDALRYFQLAASQSHTGAQYALKTFYDTDLRPRDFKEVIASCQQDIISGNKEAQFFLGMFYATGRGIEQDLTRAVGLYKQAAEQRHADADYILGWCYDIGKIKEDKSLEMAVTFYERAANQSHPCAQHNLGVCYSKGQGVIKDLKKAVEFFRLAMNQGHTNAKSSLKSLFEKTPELQLNQPNHEEKSSMPKSTEEILVQLQQQFQQFQQQAKQREQEQNQRIAKLEYQQSNAWLEVLEKRSLSLLNTLVTLDVSPRYVSFLTVAEEPCVATNRKQLEDQGGIFTIAALKKAAEERGLDRAEFQRIERGLFALLKNWWEGNLQRQNKVINEELNTQAVQKLLDNYRHKQFTESLKQFITNQVTAQKNNVFANWKEPRESVEAAKSQREAKHQHDHPLDASILRALYERWQPSNLKEIGNALSLLYEYQQKLFYEGVRNKTLSKEKQEAEIKKLRGKFNVLISLGEIEENHPSSPVFEAIGNKADEFRTNARSPRRAILDNTPYYKQAVEAILQEWHDNKVSREVEKVFQDSIQYVAKEQEETFNAISWKKAIECLMQDYRNRKLSFDQPALVQLEQFAFAWIQKQSVEESQLRAGMVELLSAWKSPGMQLTDYDKRAVNGILLREWLITLRGIKEQIYGRSPLGGRRLSIPSVREGEESPVQVQLPFQQLNDGQKVKREHDHLSTEFISDDEFGLEGYVFTDSNPNSNPGSAATTPVTTARRASLPLIIPMLPLSTVANAAAAAASATTAAAAHASNSGRSLTTTSPRT